MRDYINICLLLLIVFTSLHAMQMHSSDENSVRLSVRPLSVKRLICDKI